MKNKSLLGAFLALFGGVCWGVSGSMGQYLFTYQGMDSKWLVPIRLGLAGIILLAYSFIRHGKKILEPWKTKHDAVLTLVYGLPGVSMCQFFYFLCIQLSNAGFATILQSTAPVPVLIVTCILAKRGPKINEIISIIMALLGVTLITTHGDFSNLSSSGTALIAGLISACCIAVYNISGKSILEKYPVEIMQGWAFLLGGIVLAIIFHPWTYGYTPTAMGYFGIAFVIIVGNVLAFTSYMSGVKYVGPVKGVLLGFSEPVTAAVITVLCFGNKFTIYDAVGMALIFLMLIFLNLKVGRRS